MLTKSLSETTTDDALFAGVAVSQPTAVGPHELVIQFNVI